MEDLFASGRIVDIIIGLMAFEAIALIAYHKSTGQGIKVPQVLSNLLAGICLFLALRLAITDAHWTWIGVALGAALAAHIIDLTSRWRGR